MPGFKPLQDRVLLKRSRPRKQPSAASSFPTPPRKNPLRARCWPSAPALATTLERCTRRRFKSAIGLFGKWAGTDVLIDGADRVILKEAEILGIFETAGG